MPRGGTGTCTTPAGQPVVAGTVISDTVFNALVADIYSILTDSLSRTGSGAMSVPLTNFDGNAGAPGITFTNETGSGIYRAGANDIRMSIAGVDRAKWSTAGFLAAAADIAVLDRAGTIGIGTTNGTTITLGRAGQVVTVASTLDAAVIDRAGTIGIGTTNGTTVTVGRSGQVLTLPGTVDAATVDRAGTIGIGGTSGTTITVGRAGQVVTVASTLDSATIDRAGTIDIGTVNGTTVSLGRSGQNTAVGGTLSAGACANTTPSPAANWTLPVNSIRKSAGLVAVILQAVASNNSALWSNIVTLPAGYRPLATVTAIGVLNDTSAGLYYLCTVACPTTGQIAVSFYDNGTSLVTPPFAIDTGDVLDVSFSFASI